MTKSELSAAIADQLEFSKSQARSVLNTILETMTDTLVRGGSIEIREFGSFIVRQYGAYEGRNPATGEKVQVRRKKLPYFKVSKDLRVKVNRK